jgi:hypothetical protein
MMNLFERKLLVPVDVMITIAINVVVVVLGYYLVMAWGLLGGWHRLAATAPKELVSDVRSGGREPDPARPAP